MKKQNILFFGLSNKPKLRFVFPSPRIFAILFVAAFFIGAVIFQYAMVAQAIIENALVVAPTYIFFGTQFPQQHIETDFGVHLSDSFITSDRTHSVDYQITKKQSCKTFDVNGVCVEYYPDLCPYLDYSPFPQEAGESWMNLDKNASDTSDQWILSGNTPAEAQTYQCNLWVEVSGIASNPLSKIFADFPIKKASAFEAHIINVSVTVSDNKTIYVDDDFVDDPINHKWNTIQEGVNDAQEGDTVIVKDGTYTENIDVNKSHLTIKSQNGAEKTIIKPTSSNKCCIFNVIEDYLSIIGFTLRDQGLEQPAGIGAAIRLYNTNHNNILDNVFINNWNAIVLASSHSNIISNCNIYSSTGPEHVEIAGSNDNIISNCRIYSKNFNTGIYLYSSSSNNIISDCEISTMGYGIDLSWTTNNTITKCNIYNNYYGGIAFFYSKNNRVFLNNFINHPNFKFWTTVPNFWNTSSLITYTYNSKTYTNYLGNYWSDYAGSDDNGDGIGDTPYSIDSDKDNYPLMQPFENYISPPENQPPTVEVSASPYQDNLTKISWTFHNDPWPNLNGVTVEVVIDSQSAWSGKYGVATPNPYSVDYAYNLGAGLHAVKTIVTDELGASTTNTFSFTVSPQIPNQPPTYLDSDIGQYKSDGVTKIPEGKATDEDKVIFKVKAFDPDNDRYKFMVELRQKDEPFTGKDDGGIITSDFVNSGNEAIVTRYGLVGGGYHWQAEIVDEKGNVNIEDWQEFGKEGNVDFAADSDMDGDGLPDSWEENGHNGVDLPAMGAKKDHKDIFVYIDWFETDPFEEGMVGHTHKPSDESIKKVREAFANAPVSNPDGTTGVNLHAVFGYKIEETEENKEIGQIFPGSDCEYDWEGPETTSFDFYKNKNFPKEKWPIFHYAIFAHDLPSFSCLGGRPTGISRGIGGIDEEASDFIVAIDDWESFLVEFGDSFIIDLRATVFMHELGHNLGLGHGGLKTDFNDNRVGPENTNYKPNYLSVMNYFFSHRGLRKKRGILRLFHDGLLDYSRFGKDVLPDILENNLNESEGLRTSDAVKDYGTKYYCANSETVENLDGLQNAINWNCDRDKTDILSGDINKDGTITDGENTTPKNLSTVNEWPHLVYNGGTIGDLDVATELPKITSMPPELTLKEDLALGSFTAFREVRIDIKPNSFPNSINLKSKGTIPVAILSTDIIDATKIDPLTITLAGAHVKLNNNKTAMVSFEDINDDDIVDLVAHIDTQEIQLEATATTAVFGGNTPGGLFVEGEDSIKIVP